MKTLYDKQAADEMIARIEKISASDKPLWGKMNSAQMMAHCAACLYVVRDEQHIPRVFISYILGPVFKKNFYNDKPFGKNSPTAKQFIFPDSTDFETAKQDLVGQIRKFQEGGPEKCTTKPHAFFGKLSPEQWGKGMYKHTDHHLQQFGV